MGITNLDSLALSETLTVGGATTLNGGLTTGAVSGVTTVGPLVKFTETVTYDQFTDGGAAVGTFDLTVSGIPVGATFLYAALTAVTGFAGDTSAVLIIGDGSDTDRYNTGTPDVFSTVANGVALGAPSGVLYHPVATTITLTVTTAANFTSVSAGSLTLEFYYLT